MSKDSDQTIVYEHRIRAILSAAATAKNYDDPQIAAAFYTASIQQAKRYERECGFTPRPHT